MDKAIEKDKCAVGLSDVVISNRNHSFFFGYYGIRVEGDLIIDAAQPGCAGRFQARAAQAPAAVPMAASQQAVGGGAGGASREQLLDELSRTPGLTYEEYQRRYNIIMGRQ
ncbi:hypothetical protein D3C78_1551390 [compost metagenome]